jgi:DNA-binding response OmpR family regulator
LGVNMGTGSLQKKILLVDDDAVVLATVGQGLRAYGFDVLEACSGEEAIHLALEDRPDLVIADIRMPGMSGIEAVTSIMESIDTAVIFLSAYSDGEQVAEALKKGAALGYLVKPVSVPNMIPTIEAALMRSEDMRKMSKSLKSTQAMSLATGVIMERHAINSQLAFEVLRRHARNRQRKIHEVALELVEAEDSLNTLPVEQILDSSKS